MFKMMRLKPIRFTSLWFKPIGFRPAQVGQGLCLLYCVLGLSVQAATDPTRPPTAPVYSTKAAQAKTKPMQLQSIRISDTGRRAVIDGKTVYRGSRVRGAEVIAINPNSVLLRQADRRIELSLRAPAKFKKNSQEVN